MVSSHAQSYATSLDALQGQVTVARRLALRFESETESVAAGMAADRAASSAVERCVETHLHKHDRMLAARHGAQESLRLEVARLDSSFVITLARSVRDHAEAAGIMHFRQCFEAWARLAASTAADRFLDDDVVQLQHAMMEQGDELAEVRKSLDCLADEVRGGGLSKEPIIDMVRGEITRRLS